MLARVPLDHVPPPSPLTWPRILLTHLGPGLLFLTGFLVFADVAAWAGLPRGIGFPIAGLLLVSPLQLWLLRRAARRATGRASVLGAITYRDRVPLARAVPVTAGLLVFAAAVLAALSPMTAWLEGLLDPVLPDAWTVADDPTGLAVPVALAVLTVTVAGDGVVSAVTEELYYRGYLMPRVPVSARFRPVVGAALFTVAHLWQPELWPVVFLVQVVNGMVVQRLRSVWVAAALHAGANVGFTVLALA